MQPLPFLFPFSSALWMAVGLLWLLDASNNTAMEPYRAFIADKLPEEQRALGFTQSFFTGFGITLANISLFVFQKIITGESIADDGQSGIPYWVYGSFCWCSLLNRFGALVSFQNPGNTANSRRTGKNEAAQGRPVWPGYRNYFCDKGHAQTPGKSRWYTFFNGMPCFATGSSFRIASQNRFGIPAWKKTNPSTKKPLVGLVSLTAL